MKGRNSGLYDFSWKIYQILMEVEATCFLVMILVSCGRKDTDVYQQGIPVRGKRGSRYSLGNTPLFWNVPLQAER